MVGTLERTLVAKDFEGILFRGFGTPEMIQRYFCSKLKDYMEKNDIPLENLANLVGIDIKYLSDVLDGKREVPYELAENAVLNIAGPYFEDFLPINPLADENTYQNANRRITGGLIEWDDNAKLSVKNHLANYAFPLGRIPKEVFTE